MVEEDDVVEEVDVVEVVAEVVLPEVSDVPDCVHGVDLPLPLSQMF